MEVKYLQAELFSLYSFTMFRVMCPHTRYLSHNLSLSLSIPLNGLIIAQQIKQARHIYGIKSESEGYNNYTGNTAGTYACVLC